MSHRAPACTQQVLPLSLGRAPMNWDEYRAYFGGFMNIFSNFKVRGSHFRSKVNLRLNGGGR